MPHVQRVGTLVAVEVRQVGSRRFGLHRELQRREREAIATPEEARRSNTELRLRMREKNNYLPEIDSLRAIAVASPTRFSALPTVPTVAESGLPGYEASSWNGISVAVKTPRAIVDKLNATIVRLLAAPDVRERLIKDGAEVVGNTPDEATRFLKAEIARWGAVVRYAGAKPE